MTESILPEVKLAAISSLLGMATNSWLLDPAPATLLSLPLLLPLLLLKLAELLSFLHLPTNHRLIAATSYFLGLGFLIGLVISFHSFNFGLYLCFLTFFHLSEYLATGLGNPR